MKRFLFLFLSVIYTSISLHADITWTNPIAISTAGVDSTEPRIVIDPEGNATAAWLENGIIKSSSLSFQGSWTTPITISDILNSSSNPKLRVDSSGNVTLLWIENTIIKTTTRPFGGSWNLTATSISGSEASNPSLAVDLTGNAVAVWTRNGFIESATRTSGGWQATTIISPSQSDNAHVAISSSGIAMAAWRSIISGSHTIVTDQLSLATNIWDTRKKITTVSSSKNFPKITLDDNGNATVAWFTYLLLNENAYQNVQVGTSSLLYGGVSWT
ncbi:MAG TPA: hypothetical protein VGP47_09285, partial [Parachlamydiaceae bacterium]|nr:hypothetical protein [Parachlamydiaceae bacterium]